MKLHEVGLLSITFVVYSISIAFSKLASMEEFCTPVFWAFLGSVIISLGLYAVLWQKVLTILPLNKAFLCKSITLILGLLIAHFVFAESITLYNIIGASCIMGGLLVLSWKKL